VSYARLLLAVEGRLATLTVNRPEKRNALDTETVQEFHRALDEVRAARSTVLIVTGAGDQAFVAGADIASIRERRRDDALSSINSRLMAAVEAHEAVVIAAVNGVALGGGCELALACDLRIAAEHAVFGLPEPSLGIIPGAGGTQRLPRVVGLGRAKEMVLTGARWSAAQALQYGLVSEVVPAAELLSAARRMAERVLALGPARGAAVEGGAQRLGADAAPGGPGLRVDGPGDHFRVGGQDGRHHCIPREAPAPVPGGVR
jgi:enoyl-CoA hydratase